MALHFVEDCFHRAFFTFLRRSPQDLRAAAAESAFFLAAFLAAFPFALSLSASLHSSITSSWRSILSLRLPNSAMNLLILSSSVCNSLPSSSNTLSRSSIFCLRFAVSRSWSKVLSSNKMFYIAGSTFAFECLLCAGLTIPLILLATGGRLPRVTLFQAAIFYSRVPFSILLHLLMKPTHYRRFLFTRMSLCMLTSSFDSAFLSGRTVLAAILHHILAAIPVLPTDLATVSGVVVEVCCNASTSRSFFIFAISTSNLRHTFHSFSRHLTSENHLRTPLALLTRKRTSS